MTTDYNKSDVNSVVMNDDCCQLVFEYLPPKDKCRLERVSKQFMKLVYRTQTCLPSMENSYKVIDIDRLKYVLTKCSNIRKIRFCTAIINDPVLNVITDYCERLERIYFNSGNVTEEAITRFGRKFADSLKTIVFYKESDIEENQQNLLSLCTKIKELRCSYLLLLNNIDQLFFNNLEFLVLSNCHMWSYREIETFGRFVDRHVNTLKKLYLFSSIDVYIHLPEILSHVQRLSNLNNFQIYQNSDELHNHFPSFKELGKNCKQLKSVTLDVSIAELDLWQIFRYFDSLERLSIERYVIHETASFLIDSNSRIPSLFKLKKLKIECESIGDLFFIEISKFAANLEVFTLHVIEPTYQLSNHSLIALSKLNLLKKLELNYPNFNMNLDINYQHIDELGLLTLLDNCLYLRSFDLKYRMYSIVNALSIWMEERRKRPKEWITLSSYLYMEWIDNALKELPRMANLDRLTLTNRNILMDEVILSNQLLFECNASKKSVYSTELL